MHILLVEDDPQLGRGLKTALERWGYTSEWVCDGAAALEAASAGAFDIVLLDLGLPKIDGVDVLMRLRDNHVPHPVLVITARDSLGDRIGGLDAGADDYLVKPFELDELAARLRALHRRATGKATPELRIADVVLNTRDHLVTYRGRPVELSRTERLLLSTLAERAGRVVTREFLERVLFGSQGIESNALEYHVHSLRKKLDANVIKTARGLGYLMPTERKQK
jgi:two-component system response regulator QseB